MIVEYCPTYRPPLIRKKIQTLTIKLKPKDSEMYMSTCGLKPVSAFVVVLVSVAPMLATCVPANAKKRNMVLGRELASLRRNVASSNYAYRANKLPKKRH